MIVNYKLTEYLNKKRKEFLAFYLANPDAPVFLEPADNASAVVERIMRSAIESRALDATTDEELVALAKCTLHHDFIARLTSKTNATNIAVTYL